MQLSKESESYIKNTLTTVSIISKQASFLIVRFCSQHFCDSVKELCQQLNISRSGYYKWLGRRSKSDKYSELIRHIRKYQAISNYTTGYRKMAIYLRRHKLTSLSVSSIYRLMRKYGLLSQCVRTKKARLIQREINVYQNLLRRDFSAFLPNQKWCIDITQLNASNKKIYMCAIIDLFDRSIVAYRISDRQNKSLVKNTIKIALAKLDKDSAAPIILHSDQGYLFATQEHKHLLDTGNIIPSMSNPGSPHDNAVIESFFSCLKSECIHLLPKIRAKEMIAEVDRYVVFYNHYRIHMKFEDVPMNVRKRGLALQKCFTFSRH